MMIAAIRQQALDPGRSLAEELCFRFLPGSACGAAQAAASKLRLDFYARHQDKAEFAPAAERASPRGKNSNAALESLAGGALAGRFHAWHGGSGRRYICTVFPVNHADPEAGLPDFSGAVVIAVACEANGARWPVAFCQCETGANPYAREPFVIDALAGGASEWHVHLLATEMTQRRAVIADIEALRTCGPRERAVAGAWRYEPV
jgi:hypothetical protein